jgi:hypothetical protein
MNPKNRNGPPKVVDQTPQESLLPAGRPGLSEFPLEDRSDRLGDPPSTVFPAGEGAGPTDARRLPGPPAEATETGSRGRPEPPGHRWPGAGPPRPSTPSGTTSLDASRSRGGPGVGKSPSPPAGNASGTRAAFRNVRVAPMPHEPVERRTPSPKRPSARRNWPTGPPAPDSPAANIPLPKGGKGGRATWPCQLGKLQPLRRFHTGTPSELLRFYHSKGFFDGAIPLILRSRCAPKGMRP